LISHSFPELMAMAEFLPDGTTLDGEILAQNGTEPAIFAALQKRLQRKKVSDKMLREVPAIFLAFDCLQFEGEDLRMQSMRERRSILEAVVREAANPQLRVSELITASEWGELDALRQEARVRGVEGLMLKRWSSPYQMGRKRGDWWKWKIDPMTLDAVLLYAKAGHGKRATLFTDYTFGIWKGDQLVPFAKAYSGLTNEEIGELDSWIRRNTLERFGPVRSVKAQRVFELAFEGIQISTRHKAGIAVRFPRILRERTDKTVAQADSLESAMELLRLPEKPEDEHAPLA
jgi:DNA ligase-1